MNANGPTTAPVRPAARDPDRVTWRYRPELDGLRAIAVTMVVAYHYCKSAFPGGYLGVCGFFVLSGYLITGLVIAEQVNHGTVDMRAFLLRRVLRLYPALVCAVAATLIAAQLFGREHAATGNLNASAVASLLFLEDIVTGVYSAFGGPLDVTWSLAVEMQFYLVWPLILLVGYRLAGRQNATRALLACAVASAFATAIARLLLGWKATYFTPIGSMTPFLIGGWMALSGVRVVSGRVAMLAGGVVGAVLLLAPPSPAAGAFLGVEQVAAFSFAILIAYTLVPGGRVHLRAAPLVWLGRRSYGLYLYHLGVLFGLTNAWPGAPAWARALAGIPLSVGLAACSFRWVEEPLLRRKRRFDRVAMPAELSAAGAAEPRVGPAIG